ncbi:MAG: riboflavin synthase [Acidimicrobiia bacterium]|nr:riboflavin synthase [Acidimicrobiia bacterium]MDH3396206.1 riboflavin synthase [Acidimicrobiia bacterium]MDH5615223.1 riboflavin synthase [Acidimicrobiia bacterium]
MFTGIVEEKGRVTRILPADQGIRIEVEGPLVAPGLAVGDSIAVNGVCLTVVESMPTGFAADVVKETLDRTNLGTLQSGSSVDLERPMLASGRFDGHIVQGHVDGVGRVERVMPEGEGARMTISVPGALERFVVEKGSVTVDGVSLTIARLVERSFEVALIPHTLAVSVLGERSPGDLVNLEVDVIAKYVERLLEERA